MNASRAGRRLSWRAKGDGVISAVVFEDTCGNLINLVQPNVGKNAG